MIVSDAASAPASREPTAAQFRDPLGYIRAEHDRQQAIFEALRSVVAEPRDPGARDQSGPVLRYIVEEMPRHIADEEDGLFPLLQERSRPSDCVGDVIEMLRWEHEIDQELAAWVQASLRRLVESDPFGAPETFLQDCLAFAETQCRHLTWENQVILPLARARLTRDDLELLGRAMAARRSIAYSA